MKVSEALVRAKALIEDPAHWIQGYFAKDVNGFVVSLYGNDACCFCASGAQQRACVDDPVCAQAEKALKDAAYVLFNRLSVVSVNDDRDRKHEDIMRLFDRAIQIAQAEEAA